MNVTHIFLYFEITYSFFNGGWGGTCLLVPQKQFSPGFKFPWPARGGSMDPHTFQDAFPSFVAHRQGWLQPATVTLVTS